MKDGIYKLIYNQMGGVPASGWYLVIVQDQKVTGTLDEDLLNDLKEHNHKKQLKHRLDLVDFIRSHHKTFELEYDSALG